MSLTVLLVLINVVVFLAEMGTGGLDGPLVAAGVLDGQLVATTGEWWRIVTAAFMHANLLHIAFNMIALYQVGTIDERLYGKGRYLLLYAISLVGSGLSVVYFDWNEPTLGASGAIFGLFGALVAVGVRLGARGRALIGQVIPIIVINLVFTFSIPGISWQAHVGGLIVGFLAGLVLFMVPSRQRAAAYAYAYPARRDVGVETIDQPPDAGPHEEEDAPPLELRDPRE